VIFPRMIWELIFWVPFCWRWWNVWRGTWLEPIVRVNFKGSGWWSWVGSCFRFEGSKSNQMPQRWVWFYFYWGQQICDWSGKCWHFSSIPFCPSSGRSLLHCNSSIIVSRSSINYFRKSCTFSMNFIILNFYITLLHSFRAEFYHL
jgi:hypothetical protein